MVEEKMIVFDSKDWNSIKDTIEKVCSMGMQVSETSTGESIIFDVDGDNDIGYSLIVSVFQSNGWVRTNIYHPSDRTIEEIYRRETKQ